MLCITPLLFLYTKNIQYWNGRPLTEVKIGTFQETVGYVKVLPRPFPLSKPVLRAFRSQGASELLMITYQSKFGKPNV